MASPPIIMTPVPAADVKRGDGILVTEFIEGYCRITKESLGGSAGQLLRMRKWQNNLLSAVYARRSDGRYRHRQALIGMPRKQGKTALGSAMALHALVMGDHGSEVYSAAVDKEQARLCFGMAKRMVELDPQLDDRHGGIIHVYKDCLEYTEKGSIYKVLSSEAITKEGLSPTFVLYDELHGAPDPELYDVLTLAMGARRNPLLVAITTAGTKGDKTGQDSTCYKLYQQGMRIAAGEEEDKTFFMAWFGAPEAADYRDPEVWRAANPGYDDLVDPEDFASVINRVHEAEFRTKRLNQFVSSAQSWLPQGAWNRCRSSRDFTPGARGVVLGFDGSQNNDTTALIAVTIAAEPQVLVLGIWEKPLINNEDWQVPRNEVKDAIRAACSEYHVREVAADPYLWKDALEELASERIPVVAFPQTLTRMAPATQRMYERVQSQSISHNGNKTLARHLENCQLKVDPSGSRIVKDRRNSPRKIDAAIATIIAVDRADFWLNEPLEGSFHGVPVADIGFVWADGDNGGFVSAGEECCRCGNKVIKHLDGSPRLKRIGLQVVCDPPCAPTTLGKQEDVPEPPPSADKFYQGYMVN
jgi:phage terminase large subunit-like protein